MHGDHLPLSLSVQSKEPAEHNLNKDSEFTPYVAHGTLQDDVWVGTAALGGDAANTFYSVKRLIGRSLAEVASDVAGLRYEVSTHCQLWRRSRAIY